MRLFVRRGGSFPKSKVLRSCVTWYSLPYPLVTRTAIVRVMKLCLCVLEGVGVVVTTEVRIGFWVHNNEEKNLLGIPVRRWDDIALCLTEIGWSI